MPGHDLIRIIVDIHLGWVVEWMMLQKHRRRGGLARVAVRALMVRMGLPVKTMATPVHPRALHRWNHVVGALWLQSAIGAHHLRSHVG